MNDIDGVRDRTDVFFKADLNDGIPAEVGSGFDIVLAADVLEHVVNPGALMSSGRESVWLRTGPRSFCVSDTSPTGIPDSARPSGCSTTTSAGILDSTHLTVLHPAQPGQADSTPWLRHPPYRASRSAAGRTRSVRAARARAIRLADRLLSERVADNVRIPVHRRSDTCKDLRQTPCATRRSSGSQILSLSIHRRDHNRQRRQPPHARSATPPR